MALLAEGAQIRAPCLPAAGPLYSQRRNSNRCRLKYTGDQLSDTLLALNDVTARYGDVQVLWGVSFSVREGEIATLVGANGAGKSTTLKAISGVVKVTGGQIE